MYIEQLEMNEEKRKASVLGQGTLGCEKQAK